ncbi:hypothetical protein AWC25_11345 [Mycobacterium sherrisii]|nr:hypothetical protein AWC25_11345 [Mycobacterium sherrisii]
MIEVNVPAHPRGVVVVVNGSLSSPAAVEWAAREASLREVTLTLVAIRKPGMRRDLVWPALVAAADAIETRCTSSIELEIVDGLVIWALLGLSDYADLLILGAGYQRHAADNLMRSAPARLVQHARCPVLVIHDVDRWHPNLPVLVPVESCPSCEVAVDVGFQEASRRGVDLVTVYSPNRAIQRERFPVAGVLAPIGELADEYLQPHRGRYPDVTVRSVQSYACSDVPLREVSRATQLIVICDRAAQGFSGLRLGPLTCTVLGSVRAPVLVARRAHVHTRQA